MIKNWNKTAGNHSIHDDFVKAAMQGILAGSALASKDDRSVSANYESDRVAKLAVLVAEATLRQLGYSVTSEPVATTTVCDPVVHLDL